MHVVTTPVRPRFYLAEWIAALDITDEILSERSGVSRTHITQLRNGQKVWNERVLLKLAGGLGLQDPLLLFRPPGGFAQRDAVWNRIPEAKRNIAQETVDRVLESFADPATAPADDGGRKRVRKRRS
jgi:hypothetical protein